MKRVIIVLLLFFVLSVISYGQENKVRTWTSVDSYGNTYTAKGSFKGLSDDGQYAIIVIEGQDSSVLVSSLSKKDISYIKSHRQTLRQDQEIGGKSNQESITEPPKQETSFDFGGQRLNYSKPFFGIRLGQQIDQKESQINIKGYSVTGFWHHIEGDGTATLQLNPIDDPKVEYVTIVCMNYRVCKIKIHFKCAAADCRKEMESLATSLKEKYNIQLSRSNFPSRISGWIPENQAGTSVGFEIADSLSGYNLTYKHPEMCKIIQKANDDAVKAHHDQL